MFNPILSDAQREAGNYRMDHLRIHGLGISIETRKGDRRRPQWPPMAADYGYLKGTRGRDGDHVDCFIGPNPQSELVFVIDQSGPTGDRFDEHKCLIGFDSKETAIATYKRCYKPGWHLGPVTTMTIEQFKNWLAEGNQMRPVHKQVSRYSNLADLHLPHNPAPFIERYQQQAIIDRYEWVEWQHPRNEAGSAGGVGGQFRRSNQSSAGGAAQTDSEKAWVEKKNNQAEIDALKKKLLPPGYAFYGEFMPDGGLSRLREMDAEANRRNKVNSMPGSAKSSKIRDVASAPTLDRAHELHWSKAGEYADQIYDWHHKLHNAMREMTLEHTAGSDGADRDHKWEQAWQAGDKKSIRDLLAQMNQMDKEARAKGIRLADFVNANGLIPRELAERLSSGSRFFDPERLGDKIREGNKRAGIKPQPVEKPQYKPAIFTGNKRVQKDAPQNPKEPEPAQEPEPQPKAAGNRPGGSLSPRMLASAQQKVWMDTREPFEPGKPSTPEQLQSAIASAFDKLSKQGQKSLDAAISKGFAGDDGEELPSDSVADLRESVIDTWNQMRSQAEDFNAAYDQVIKGMNKGLGVGASNLRSRLTKGLDYDKIPGFDQAAEFARNHYPHLLTASSGESEGQGDDEHLLAQAIIRGKMEVPEQPWHAAVIDEAVKRIGPSLAAAMNADVPSFAQDPDDPDYVPFSVQSIVDEIERYMAELEKDFCFSA